MRVRAVDAYGRRVKSFRAPAPPLAHLVAYLKNLWKRWGIKNIPHVIIGASGVWTVSEKKRLKTRLGGLAKHIQVMSDVEAAFEGALGGAPGILVLAGTGSIAYGRDRRGRPARAGGRGPLFGDEGSAYWLGKEYLRHTSRGEDFQPLRKILASPNPTARIAALAPRVLARAQKGDAVCRKIVREGQVHLAKLVEEVARSLSFPGPIRVSWAGGLLKNPFYLAGFRRVLRRGSRSYILQAPKASALAAVSSLSTRSGRW